MFVLSVAFFLATCLAAPAAQMVYSLTTVPFNLQVLHKQSHSYFRHYVVPFVQHGRTMYGMEFNTPKGQFQIINGRLVYSDNGLMSFGSVGEYDIVDGIKVLNVNGLEDNQRGVESRFSLHGNKVTLDKSGSWYVCHIENLSLRYPLGVVAMIDDQHPSNVPTYCQKVDLIMSPAL